IFVKGTKNPVLGRHRPCTARPAAASRGHRDFRHRPDCGCGDAASIAAEARARGCFGRGTAYEFSCRGSLEKGGGAGIAGHRWYLPINGSKVRLHRKSNASEEEFRYAIRK